MEEIQKFKIFIIYQKKRIGGIITHIFICIIVIIGFEAIGMLLYKKVIDRICGKTDLNNKKNKKIETYYNRIKYKEKDGNKND